MIVIVVLAIMSPRFVHAIGLLCMVIASAIYCPGVGSSSGNIRCIETEKHALLQFKQGLLDDTSSLASWKSSKDCCEWARITCNNQTGNVVMLDLYNDGTPLRGEIRSSILELRYLNYLDLSYNGFWGMMIPEFIGSLSQLKELKLAHAGFIGPIPPQLGNLSNLITLDLSKNNVTSKNLEWLSHLSSLRYLYMAGHNFSEVVNWPQSISKLSSLVELDCFSCQLTDFDHTSVSYVNSSISLQKLGLSDNHFSNSSIFYWIANFSRNHLDSINLSGNLLQGLLPDVFTTMASLGFLRLSSNNLEGGIPKSFQSLCNLQLLTLYSNKFSGKLQDSIANLSCAKGALKHLDMSQNLFWGSFPDDLTKFSSLSRLFIISNNLSGPLPPDFTGLSALKTLLLSSNQLIGSIPESIGLLSSLQALGLYSNSLSGTITEAHFLNLSSLQSLDISYNPLSVNLSLNWHPPFQLDGLVMSSCMVGPAFPKWVATQRKLSYLEMSNAAISDSIPNSFWDISYSIVSLNLSMNQITGSLPNLSSPNCSILILDLSSNQLSGPLPSFPPNLAAALLSNNMFSGPLSSLSCAATHVPPLEILDLSKNLLSGELPNCWMKVDSLQSLNLAKNGFFGKIPSSLGYLENIIALHLNDNKFSGELPSLEYCTALRVVDLGGNKLSGQIPVWIGQRLTNLYALRLRSNKFYGSIPLTLCGLSVIHVLDLSRNNISGFLPHCMNNITALSSDEGVDEGAVLRERLTIVQVVWKGVEIEFGANLKHLRSIDISSNYLVGDIPEDIATMTKLNSLNLSRNTMTGKLPDNFGQLKMLESLDLSRNQLSGRIPASFSSLNFLSVLDLSYNNLSGRIPQSTQLQSFSAFAYIENVGLCGPPLTQQCLGDETAQDPGITSSSEIAKTKDFGVAISIVLGFFTGFWGVCGTLLLKSSWRWAYFRYLSGFE